jgi:hypothetical protein
MFITPLPTPPTRQDPTNFATRADTFLAALPTFATEANAAAATIYTAFDPKYLGARTTAPTVGSGGGALLVGDVYWNTTQSKLYSWNGSTWVQSTFSVATSVSSFNTRSGAVTLTRADVESAAYVFSSASTANTAVLRDASSNFAANAITAVDFNSTSDQSLKENVVTLNSSIDTINELNPVSFNWKESGTKSYGVIAQEIQQVLPELVKQDSAGTLSVNYIPLIAMLLDAVQELDKRVKYLESK